MNLIFLNKSFITRRCTEECIVNGIKIPVGLVIAVDVLSLHYDPNYWGDNVDEFYPMRHVLIEY